MGSRLTLLLLVVAAGISNGSNADSQASSSPTGKPSDADTKTIYCSGNEAYNLELCQNRVFMMNKLFAADILGYCKYNWWADKGAGVDSAGGASRKQTDLPVDQHLVPGFDADFTNLADAENRYLYAVRKMRVRASSDVWLCSDQNCRMMQDVGFVRANHTDELNVFTAASYMKNTMVALPLAGKPANARTHCETVDASSLHANTSVDVPGYQLCFADQNDVIAASDSSFVPSMVPAYPAAAGVGTDLGPYARLMVGTYESNVGCVRLVLPRHKWLLDHGWGNHHGCDQDMGDLVFIAYFLTGWADPAAAGDPVYKVVNATDDNLQSWQTEGLELKLAAQQSRILWCDDDAMSSAFSGAQCSVQDLTGPWTEYLNLNNATGIDYNSIELLIVGGIPIVAYNLSTVKYLASEPGLLAPMPQAKLDDGEADLYTDFKNSKHGTNPVNSTHVARWLFAADMMARDNTTVPWCGRPEDVVQGDTALPVYSDYSSDYASDVTVNLSFYINFGANETTGGNDNKNCDLLDKKGLLTLRGGLKPTEPFHTLLSPALIAWQPYSGQTLTRHNLGFAGAERLPPQAILRAALESIQTMQGRAQAMADELISTADMTATYKGAFLNLFAFTTVAIVVWFTAADFVKVIAEDVLLHKKQWIWVLYVFPFLVFTATLMPAPVLALLQEVNARNNNPDGDLNVGYTQVIARGYGNYHLLIFTAYRSEAIYRPLTEPLAIISVVLPALGVVLATSYAVLATYRLGKRLEEESGGDDVGTTRVKSPKSNVGLNTGDKQEQAPLVGSRGLDAGNDVERQQGVLGGHFTDVDKIADDRSYQQK